jgi:hypothetical protein
VNGMDKKSPIGRMDGQAWGRRGEEAGGSVGTPSRRAARPGYAAGGASRPAAKDVVTLGYGCLIAQATRKHGRKADERSGSHG